MTEKRRPLTLQYKHLTHVRKLDVIQEQRPVTRADCENGERPCPWVSCRHHMYLDVNPQTGSIKINFPQLDPGDMENSCVLDIADRGEKTLEEIGALMNITRERIRQLEFRGMHLLRAMSPTPDTVGTIKISRRMRGMRKRRG